jgi:SAM-dependent methyltransferase
MSEFDQYSTTYEAALNQGLHVSGESAEYFAQGRVAWLRRRLAALGYSWHRVLDFGCGLGIAAPFFLEDGACEQFVGVEPSSGLVEQARRGAVSDKVRFDLPQDREPGADVDVAYCNGVFHHIVPDERQAAIRYVFDSLRPGGFFALCENNPYNLGTRYVMSRIPFDKDAVMLSPGEARQRLQQEGFTIVETDFLFIFPRCLHALRPLEALVYRMPLGAQYMVLARKPV